MSISKTKSPSSSFYEKTLIEIMMQYIKGRIESERLFFMQEE